MFVMYTVIITGSTTLRVLHVGGNVIGDDGISMISEELQYNNSLTELSVVWCGLSVKGKELINFVFFACASISEYCYLCYYIIPYMVTSVRYIIIVIVMITTGAIVVSKLLVGNCTLQYLNVGNNAISDDGISVIVEQLQHITTLTTLYVWRCELSVKGEELINFVFFACTSICEYCCLIPYMVTSVRYIIIVIVMITTGAIAVSKLLVGNCTLQVLSVSDNDIGDDGILVIVEQLQHNTTLTELYVSECGLSVKGSVVCVRCILVQTVRITLQYH